MGRSSGGLLILLAACIIGVDQCTCERLDYERDLCTDARVVVGNKYYTIVDDAGVTFGQAVSICGSVGGRLASTRYPSYYRAYRELMNTVYYSSGLGLFDFKVWVDIRPDPGTNIWRHPDGTEVEHGVSPFARNDVFDDPALRCTVGYNTYTYDTVSCQELWFFACELDLVLDGPESPCFPTVVLDTGSRPYDSPFQLLRAGDFSTFGSIIDLDCPGDYSIAYTWRVWQEVVPSHSDEMADIPAERPYRYNMYVLLYLADQFVIFLFGIMHFY